MHPSTPIIQDGCFNHILLKLQKNVWVKNYYICIEHKCKTINSSRGVYNSDLERTKNIFQWEFLKIDENTWEYLGIWNTKNRWNNQRIYFKIREYWWEYQRICLSTREYVRIYKNIRQCNRKQKIRITSLVDNA